MQEKTPNYARILAIDDQEANRKVKTASRSQKVGSQGERSIRERCDGPAQGDSQAVRSRSIPSGTWTNPCTRVETSLYSFG